MSEEDDFDLNELDDKDLVEQIQDDLYDGLADEVTEGTEILLSRGWDANDVLGDALVGGMKIVGVDFRDGILFVPEVLKCAGAMKGGMKILRPILAEAAEDTSLGKFVIGTVKGDIHDIGKNLVGMMLEGAGFKIVDLGVNTDPLDIIKNAEEVNADIVGLSALLTTSMPFMGLTIKAFKEEGKNFPIICGGAPVTRDFAEKIGAHGYADNAVEAVILCKSIIEERALAKAG